MVKALFDTNILIDYLNGIPQARTELDLHDDKFISVISWMEVMACASASVEAATRGFLNSFTVLGVTTAIAERAVKLRRDRRLKLPDAIIYASAETNDLLLVTRDVKDFTENSPSIRVPYKL